MPSGEDSWSAHPAAGLVPHEIAGGRQTGATVAYAPTAGPVHLLLCPNPVGIGPPSAAFGTLPGPIYSLGD